MKDVKRRALELLSDGYSIVPIRRGEKIPAIKWEEYQKRMPTVDEIDQWIEYIGEDINFGIVTGKISNLVVVDIDKDKNTGEMGNVDDFPDTLTVKTGSGGLHLYYRYPKGKEITNKARIRPLTDIRGEGGQVVAPGSIHANGYMYEWYNDMPIADFPLELLKESERNQYEPKDWSVIETGVSQGNRNATAASFAGKLQRRFHPNEHESEAWPIFQNWNLSNDPPLSDKELRGVWESIARRSINDVRYDSGSYGNAPVQQKTNKVEEKVITDGIEKVTWTEALRLAEKELKETTPEDCLGFGYNFLDDALTGIFPGELIVIGGSTGTGKSTLAMNVCHFAANKGHKVFVFALEDRIEDYGMKAIYFKMNQIAKMEEGTDKETYSWNLYRKNCYDNELFLRRKEKAIEQLKNDNISFIKVDKRLNFATLEKMIDEEMKDGTELFLIDHLHYFDLDSSSLGRTNYIENFIVDLRTMQRRNKARILLICHYRKLNNELPTLDSFKDSSSISQNANYVINLFRDRGESASKIGKKSNDSINSALSQLKTSTEKRYIDTFFLIPKSRNPNGESTIIVKYDKMKGEYLDKPSYEFQPMPDGLMSNSTSSEQERSTEDFDW